MPIRKDGKIKVAAITKDGKIKTVEVPEYCMCSDCASKPPSKKCVCPFCASSEDDDDDKSLGEWDLPSDYIGKLPDRVWDDMEKGELPEKKKAETTDIKKAKNTYSGSSHRLYMRRKADKYLKPIQFPLDEIEVRYYHHNHHRDDPDDQDSTEDEGSMKSRTKKKKMMPRMEKKLSRTENMSLKDATEAEGSKQSRTEKKMMPLMEKQDQGSKLSRTEKKSKKDAIEGLKLELLNLVVGPPLQEDTKKPKKSIIHSKPSTSERPPWR